MTAVQAVREETAALMRSFYA
ncbi:hypothetical protein CLS_02280 [[Clostridium] cf. saccharolyticum K10]|nr:hypothetical protein CLS_02280 [[Clostridium] cf. saccharolyticum K10]